LCVDLIANSEQGNKRSDLHIYLISMSERIKPNIERELASNVEARLT